MEIFKWNLMFLKKKILFTFETNECGDKQRASFQNDITINDHCGGTQSSISSSYQA